MTGTGVEVDSWVDVVVGELVGASVLKGETGEAVGVGVLVGTNVLMGIMSDAVGVGVLGTGELIRTAEAVNVGLFVGWSVTVGSVVRVGVVVIVGRSVTVGRGVRLGREAREELCPPFWLPIDISPAKNPERDEDVPSKIGAEETAR